MSLAEVLAFFVGEDTIIWRYTMTDILGRLGDLAGLGKDALIEVLAGTINALGQFTEFSGDEIAKLGELEQRLGDIIRGGKGGDGGGGA